MFPLTDELHKAATNYRGEMLKIAQNCYRKASECETEDNEEEWLHHYMLGKVAEKMGQPPREYLEHYKQVGWPPSEYIEYYKQLMMFGGRE